MELEALESVMDEYMKKLPTSKTKMIEAEDLQSEFLEIQELVAKTILEFEIDHNELSSVSKMEFKRAMMVMNPGKTAPEKKACSEGDEDYLEVAKARDNAKATIYYLRTRLQIFNDAHLCCRTLAKGSN